MLLAKASRSIFAFEPLPRNIAFLVRTLAANGIRNAQVIPWVLGGKTGIDAFKLGEHSSEGKVDADGTLPVFTVTCDEFAARYQAIPGLLKIDVEGTDLEVLQGASGILRSRKPAILLSTHGDGPKEACLRFVRDIGYRTIKPLDGLDEGNAREFSLTS